MREYVAMAVALLALVVLGWVYVNMSDRREASYAGAQVAQVAVGPLHWMPDPQRQAYFSPLLSQSSGMQSLSVEGYTARLGELYDEARLTGNLYQFVQTFQHMVAPDGLLLSPRNYYVGFPEQWYLDYETRMAPYVDVIQKKLDEATAMMYPALEDEGI